jgi:serine/threonine protein phosphatase PrpC
MQYSFPIENCTWRVVGASVTGTSHLKHGRGCDDAHACRQLENGAVLLVAADGAGSADHSAEGARLAVHVALRAVETAFAQQVEPVSEEQLLDLLRGVLRTVREALEELAAGNISAPAPLAGDATEADQPPEQTALPLHEFATTLLLALASPQWIAVGQIGDGVVVAQDIREMLHVLTTPDHGEYLNETTFITDRDYLERAQLRVLTMEIQGVAVLTDGLQLLAVDLNTHMPFKPFFAPLFKFAANAESTGEELQAFLASERVCARTDDDKTLVLAVQL